MIWDEADQQAMRRIFGQVWASLKIALPVPRRITPRWTTAPRGRTLSLPLPRSWLGVGAPTPLRSFLTHTLTEGLTMNLKRATLPAVLVLSALVGAGVGATLTPPGGVGAPTPQTSAPFVLPEPLLSAVTCTEDEPCWDCETMGNRVCNTMAEPMKRSAWAAWAAHGGAGQLLVNPHARVSLTGYSVTDPYEQGVPALGIQQLALHESGVWFIFTAQAV